MIVFVIVISLLLESILSNAIPLSSFFTPLFSIVSLVIIYPYFVNNDLKFLKYCGVVGLIYDLVFTNTLFLNMFVFIIIGLVIKLINITLSNNFINVMIITILATIAYLVTTYFILTIIGYKTFNLDYLVQTISRTLILNSIYSFVLYIVTDKISKKHKILKID